MQLQRLVVRFTLSYNSDELLRAQLVADGSEGSVRFHGRPGYVFECLEIDHGVDAEGGKLHLRLFETDGSPEQDVNPARHPRLRSWLRVPREYTSHDWQDLALGDGYTLSFQAEWLRTP